MIVSEHVSVVFRAATRLDDDALPRLEASREGPVRLVAEVPGVSAGERARRWRVEVEVEVNLEGVNLDPEYWLRHCHGFLVDSETGENLGVVDDVELAPDSERAIALVVALGWFGRRTKTIAVADVQAIVPSQRRLIVRDLTRAFDPEPGPS